MARIPPAGRRGQVEEGRGGMPGPKQEVGADSPFAQRLTGVRQVDLRKRMDEQLQRVDALGARLAESLTITDAKAYRAAVREFVAFAQQASLALQSEMEWDHRTWEERTLVWIRKVDADLDALAQEVLSGQADRMAILARMGAIKGMLLDLRV